ncbi:DUF4232 domain-containing protein [Streptomyces sp. H27-D2]|uniref:DUF4232 domain-containing protein n=1 Tax=Streptomyces sp. H27-D2 TaxID=3046304 RepID=UPI002DBDA7D6|nr:DUF4232 domain-containing protein [Streptomyces sp. H27-D2]MEC4020631.1 DUF4232 domain-containing protein [Streptomyces sp. H27-D2]
MDRTQSRARRMPPTGLALTLAAAAVLAGACGTQPARKAASAPAAPEPCVKITAEQPDAAMGLRAMGIVLVNCGERPYKLNGYPSVRVLDADRKPLDVEVRTGASVSSAVVDPGPEPVTLRPGGRAVATVVWRNTVTGAREEAVNGSYLRIAPAADRASQTVPSLIDLGTTGTLDVTAWTKPGRRG